MTTDTSTTPARADAKPEHALSFAKQCRGETVWNLWAKPTTNEWWMAGIEGQLRAIAVLGLEVDGDKPSERAAELGQIFTRIARDQFGRRRSFSEVDAIAHFWGLIGELAAAYTTPENLGFAAKVVCRRAARHMAHLTELRSNQDAGSERRRRSKKRKKARRA
jgi:hypothetical protein